MTMLFCNIGWMENYEGVKSNDKIIGGGKYIHENERGFEVCNFSKTASGMVYGNVQPTRNSNVIKLERLGGDKQSEYLDGVTVIWTAKREGLGTVIVGWYKDARVYRHYNTTNKLPALHKKNGIDGYFMSAKAENTYLLPVDERVVTIPRKQKGGMGQSNVWYADQAEGITFKKQVSEYLALEQDPHKIKPKVNFKTKQPIDQLVKLAVEKKAIEMVYNYYDKLGYAVHSVERDNLGYDLVAKKDKLKLHIEVKGLSGTSLQIGLTPNEYTYFMSNNPNYRLIIVNNALHQPTMTVCRYSSDSNEWIVEGEKRVDMQIEPKTAAIIKIG